RRSRYGPELERWESSGRASSGGQNILDVAVGGDPQHMMAVPERVKEQAPRRLVPFLRVREHPLNILPGKGLGNPRRGVDEILDERFARGDPFSRRRVESQLAGVWFRGGQVRC